MFLFKLLSLSLVLHSLLGNLSLHTCSDILENVALISTDKMLYLFRKQSSNTVLIQTQAKLFKKTIEELKKDSSENIPELHRIMNAKATAKENENDVVKEGDKHYVKCNIDINSKAFTFGREVKKSSKAGQWEFNTKDHVMMQGEGINTKFVDIKIDFNMSKFNTVLNHTIEHRTYNKYLCWMFVVLFFSSLMFLVMAFK